MHTAYGPRLPVSCLEGRAAPPVSGPTPVEESEPAGHAAFATGDRPARRLSAGGAGRRQPPAPGQKPRPGGPARRPGRPPIRRCGRRWRGGRRRRPAPPAAAVEYIEAAPREVRTDHADGQEPPPAELVGHREARQQRQAHAVLHHARRQLDGLHLQRDVGGEADPAEQLMAQRPVRRIPVEEDERLVRDVGKPDGPGRGHRRTEGPDEDQGILAEADGLDVGVMQRSGDADLRVAAEHHLQELSGVPRPDGNHHAPVENAKALQRLRQQVRAERGDGGEMERGRALPGVVLDGEARERGGLQDLLGMRTKLPPRAGEREASPPSLEEPHRERRLQPLDAGADGRLGKVQGFGSPAKAPEGRDREEGFHLSDLHSLTRPSARQESRAGIIPSAAPRAGGRYGSLLGR